MMSNLMTIYFSNFIKNPIKIFSLCTVILSFILLLVCHFHFPAYYTNMELADSIAQSVTPNEVYNAIKQYTPNIIIGVPTLFEALIKNKNMRFYKMPFLKCAISGGDSLSVELKKKVKNTENRQFILTVFC